MSLLFWVVLSALLILWFVAFYFINKLSPSMQTIIDTLKNGYDSEVVKIELEKNKKRLNIIMRITLLIVIILISYGSYAVYLKFKEPPKAPSCYLDNTEC